MGFRMWLILESAAMLPTNYASGFPVILTTYHQAFATLVTQILARTTTVLDGRKNVKMSGRVYLRAVVPIGLFFSLSLICGNVTYLYLSVAFIQMLKATTPVAVLLSGWVLGVSAPNMKQFLNVSIIVVGVIVASIGEIHFVLIGVLYQIGGVIFEATRLSMVQRLLSSADFKMDPLVSVYYFAPICAIINGLVALVWEVPNCSLEAVFNVGLFTFFLNGLCAFMLNVSVVILVCSSVRVSKIHSLIAVDWKNFCCCPHPVRCSQGHHVGCRFYAHLGYSCHRPTILRLLYRSWRHGILQARFRPDQGIHWRG